MTYLAPTGTPKGQAFPPGALEARAAVDGRLVRQAASRWVAYACAVSIAMGSAGLLEAYRVLSQVTTVSGRRFSSARVCAAANMGAVLATSGARSHLILAQLEQRTVDGLGHADDRIVAGLLEAAREVGEGLASLRVPAPLVWLPGHPVLSPASPLATERVRNLPSVPLEGTWEGVRGILRNHGLEPEGASLEGAVVRVTRVDGCLRVEDIDEAELLSRYAVVLPGDAPSPDGSEPDDEGPTDDELLAIEAESA